MDYLQYFQENMYGYWREGEVVSFTKESDDSAQIQIATSEKQVSFSIQIHLPKEEIRGKYKNGSPFMVCMHPIPAMDYALENGYAVLVMDTRQIASDDIRHNGCFYDLYPYGEESKSQTGVLMAWAWGASKVLDAVMNGMAEEYGLDKNASIVTGVSRWGKATAVCGAFDKRFRLVMPTCSGAGGLALYDVVSTGNTYNFEALGGPKEYTYGDNEPLSCLQSDAERGWFCDAFLQYKTPDDISVGQEMLPILAADKNRCYLIIAACMSEDWVNAPAMWECYKKANAYYEENGMSDRLTVHFHKEGHAVIEEDLRYMIPYFDKMILGIVNDCDIAEMKTTVFARQ